MPDTISEYRVIRLVIHPTAQRAYRSYWSLHAVGHRRGIPTAAVLLDGFVPPLRRDCTTEEIVEAIDAVSRQTMLPRQ